MTEPNWENRTLFHGDNLDFMRAMNSESVDLIATDPPFNKGRDFHATPDSLAAGASFQDRWSWERDVHQEWVDQLTDDHPALMEAIESAIHAHSEGMGAYMCFMAVRLLAMRRLLKPTGSIYLHCDPTASHYLKAVMDAIFGQKNFRNQIVWCYTGRLMVSKRSFNSKHEIIFFYSKSKHHAINPITETVDKQDYIRMKKQKVHRDSDGREWIWGHAGKGKSHEYRIYLDDVVSKGKAVSAEWRIPIINTSSKERAGYPTQKPLGLYDRIVKASSNEVDIVLDPFCGCATTLVAAERLNRQWAGIDIWNKAHEVVIQRLQDQTGIFGNVHYTDKLPKRTDSGETAAPHLQVKLAVEEPPGRRMSRQEMYEVLLSHQGIKCQGCDRTFDDQRYLELDHNTPRSDGGINHISNRILLCGPCNKLKSNQYTLTGMRRKNKKLGYMAKG